jgi:hypothetical protein
MKRINILVTVGALAAVFGVSLVCLRAADTQAEPSRRFEFATIRWGGRDNTHIIRPNGQVEFPAQLGKIQKPSRTDDRAFYMNLVMNGLAKEGYEFAGMSSDDIVMKRVAAH